MKIQKTIQLKWQIQQPQNQQHIIKIKNRGKKHHKSSSFGNIFGLPQFILQQPKLSQIKLMIRAKNDSFKQFLQHNEHTQQKKYFNNNLRNTLTNRVRQIISPLKRQKVSIQSSNSRADHRQDKIEEKEKNKLSSSPPKEVISLLQKIIFQQTIKPKQKIMITVEANKLPMIDLKEVAKTKHLLPAYEQKEKTCRLKNDRCSARLSRSQAKPQKMPYLSGWETTQPITDF